MLAKITFTAIAALLSVSSCHAIPQDRIVGGQDAAAGEVPYIVALELKDSSCSTCGGILIDANTVLTAAHCSKYAPESVQVRAGSLVGPSLVNSPSSIVGAQNVAANPRRRSCQVVAL
jgi:trypsin